MMTMKTLIDRLRGQHAETGHGWHCPPCRINAGDPDSPFANAFEAQFGLHMHVRDSHGGVEPDGAYSGEVTWSEPGRR
jgi:hypothetical protein